MDGKIKISFGIKTSKQGSIPKKNPTVSEDVEFISSFDGTSKPKSASGNGKEGGELVIPARANSMKGPQEVRQVKEEGSASGEGAPGPPSSSLSLEQLAAQEILKDAKGANFQGQKPVDVVPLPVDTEADANEATLEDYESVPVQDFGKAMLRGMGWEPGKGIGKNQRVVSPSSPQLRPKGLGLGADRAPSSTNLPLGSARQGAEQQAEVPLTIGSGVQIIAGGHRGLYGQMVSRNEDTGRCIIKLEIGGSCVSVNENCVKGVSKEEYSSNCKVLNAAKYNKYKESSDRRLQEMREDAREAEDGTVEEERRQRRRRDRSRSPHK